MKNSKRKCIFLVVFTKGLITNEHKRHWTQISNYFLIFHHGCYPLNILIFILMLNLIPFIECVLFIYIYLLLYNQFNLWFRFYEGIWCFMNTFFNYLFMTHVTLKFIYISLSFKCHLVVMESHRLSTKLFPFTSYKYEKLQSSEKSD